MNAPMQKPRKVSDLIDTNAPAYRVVQKGGGLTKFCKDFDFSTSTVHSWLTKRNGRGGSGLIPSRTRYSEEHGKEISYQAWIIHRGRQLDPPVEYGPEDFVEAEEAI